MSSSAYSSDDYDLGADEPTSASATDVTDENANELLQGFCDDLLDRSADKRLKSLQNCGRVLALHFNPDVKSVLSTLLDAIENSLKRGSSLEKQAAVSLLQVVILTVGMELPGDVYGRFRPQLAKLIKDADVEPSALGMIVAAFAMLSFVCEESADFIEDDIALLASTFELTESQVSSAGISSWTLLLTTIKSETIISDYLDDQLLQFSEMLPGSDLPKSIAIGEAMAYLLEVARSAEEYEMDDLLIDPADIAEQLNNLAADRSRKMSKQTQKDRRKNFRQLAKAIESGAAPSVSLVINKQELKFDTWEQIVQLNALRTALRSGLQTHLHYNDLLHQIFDVNLSKEVSAHRLSRLDKRKYCSKNSESAKSRTESRAAARAKKMVH